MFLILVMIERPPKTLLLLIALSLYVVAQYCAEFNVSSFKYVFPKNIFYFPKIDAGQPPILYLKENCLPAIYTQLIRSLVLLQNEFLVLPLQREKNFLVPYLVQVSELLLILALAITVVKFYVHQRRLQKQNENIQKRNKQLENFAHIVSHDLKSPVAGLSTVISLLEYEQDKMTGKELQANIRMLAGSADYLCNMIDTLLSYSKKNYYDQAREIVDTNMLVNQIWSALIPPANITISIPEKMPVLYTRKIKLQQVFQNLLSNAIKYNHKKSGIVKVGCEDKKDRCIFYIKDNGPGISSYDQQRIFRLFETGNEPAERESSTGVGLNIFKMLVEEQGGRVWVDSVYAKGSTFYFEWIK